MKTAFLILMFAVISSAQTSNADATTVQGHRLGETFQEWLNDARLDPIAACQKKPDAAAVQRLTEIVNDPLTGSDGFAKHQREWGNKQLCESLLSIRATNRGQFTTDHATWVVTDGKIVMVEMIFNDLTTTPEEQVKFLTEKYGKPAEDTIATYQNGFGAIWRCPEFRWVNSDGSQIITYGTSLNGSRYFHVVFGTADQFKVSPKKNPY